MYRARHHVKDEFHDLLHSTNMIFVECHIPGAQIKFQIHVSLKWDPRVVNLVSSVPAFDEVAGCVVRLLGQYVRDKHAPVVVLAVAEGCFLTPPASNAEGATHLGRWRPEGWENEHEHTKEHWKKCRKGGSRQCAMEKHG